MGQRWTLTILDRQSKGSSLGPGGPQPYPLTIPRHSLLLCTFLLASTTVSYTHLRAHETPEHLVCRLLLKKKKKKKIFFFFFFFNDTATTEIYTRSLVGSVRCV